MAVPSLPLVVWVIVALVLLEGGWMAFDGARAWVVGDYVTPTSGKHAGELGPWSQIVDAVGIEPRSTFMKAVFVTYGVLWIAIVAAAVFTHASWSWWALVAAAACTLWYLPIGTLVSVVQLVLLLLPSTRGVFG